MTSILSVFLGPSNLKFILPSYIRQLLTIQPPGPTRLSSYPSLYRPPVSSSLKFCNRSFAYAAPALWNGLPKDLHQFALPPNRALNFTYPPLALSSATFHSLLKTELFKISSRVAYAADCGSRGFCMIIFGQYTKIIGESIRKHKNHVANFYDGFPVFWAIF